MRQEIYSSHLKLNGKEHHDTLREAENYASSLLSLQHYEEARSLLHRMIPVARRVLDASHDTMIRMSRSYAKALYKDPGATLDDLNEAVTTLEETARTARRVMGGSHPLAVAIEKSLLRSRAKLRARGGSFQRASEEKLRTRRIVSVADRFRHPAATRPTPGRDESRSTSDNQSSARAATDDDAKKRDRAIAEAIPTDADQLFKATVDWAAVRSVSLIDSISL